MHASGTFFFGFSTASEFWAADSMPRNAHNVSAIDESMPFRVDRPCGFQAAANVSDLNQNQPISERPATGMMTPQTVIAPILPVMLGPPKFDTVVSQINPITPMHVATGVDDSHGKNAARYPTAEIAIATLPIASETK